MELVRSFTSASFIHQGGEACIYKVQGESSKTYSFKWYNAGVSYDASVIEKLQKLNVPGVYRILESGAVEGRPYIVYDYVDGVSSKELSPMPLGVALHSLRKIVAALQFLRGAGISHGDINPSNVFFDRSASPVLMDFGIVGPGALHYSAPERFSGAAPSEKSDLFSLGALLYFWVAGEPLLEGETFEDYTMTFAEKCEPRQLCMSETCYYLGETKPFKVRCGKSFKLSHDLFDNDAIFLTDMAGEVTLKGGVSKRFVKVTYPGMKYVGFWHKPRTEAPYVCIEPWMSVPADDGKVDDLETKRDMLRLASGAEYEQSFTITIG